MVHCFSRPWTFAESCLAVLIPMDKPINGEMVRASIIAAHGQLFIRSARKLYCVGKGR